MTKNQIDYWNYKENSRHNREMERETRRTNLSREYETQRANKAQESLKQQANEIQRQGQVINAQTQASKIAEDTRYHMAVESNQSRSIGVDESRVALGYQQDATNRWVAQTNVGATYAQIGLGYSQLTESVRHNTASEAVNVTQAATQRAQARTAQNRAEVEASKVALEREKWNDPVAQATRRQEYSNVIFKGQLTQAQAKETNLRGIANIANAINNTVSTGGRLLSTIGGKLQ